MFFEYRINFIVQHMMLKQTFANTFMGYISVPTNEPCHQPPHTPMLYLWDR